jgi:transposase
MISSLTKEEFTKAAWEVVGRKVEKSLLLSDIYETAKASARLPVSPDSDAIRMFRLMLAEERSLIRQRNTIEDRAVELLGERPDYQLLRTIPGIGPINALIILAETGELHRFHHHRQFLKFCGMDLATVQPACFAVEARYPNMAMSACAALCGWQGRRRS